MIDQTAVFGQFKGRVLHAYGLIYAAWLAVSDFMVDMFHAENIAKWDYRWQPGTVAGQDAATRGYARVIWSDGHVHGQQAPVGPVGHRGRGSEVPLPVLQGETGKKLRKPGN